MEIKPDLKGFENKETMSQQSSTSKVKSDALSAYSEKWSVRFTEKGLAFYAKTCQEKRSLKCKQAKKNMEQIGVLMESTDNVDSVQSQLGKCIKCYEEANDTHESFLSLNLPESEVQRQK